MDEILYLYSSTDLRGGKATIYMASLRISSPTISGDSPNLREFEFSSPSHGDRDALSSPWDRDMLELEHRGTFSLSPRSSSHSPPETVETVLEVEIGDGDKERMTVALTQLLRMVQHRRTTNKVRAGAGAGCTMK